MRLNECQPSLNALNVLRRGRNIENLIIFDFLK